MPPEDFLFQVEFFSGPGGDEPVQSDLRSLNRSNRALAVRIEAVLRRLEDPRYPGPPQTKALGDGLFEARLGGSDAARILFFHADVRRLIIVHAFVKKSQRLPRRDLALAQERKKTWMQMRQETNPSRLQ